MRGRICEQTKGVGCEENPERQVWPRTVTRADAGAADDTLPHKLKVVNELTPILCSRGVGWVAGLGSGGRQVLVASAVGN